MTSDADKAKQDNMTALISSYNSLFGDYSQRSGIGKFTTSQTADPMGR
jgi:hypothetical protein